MDALTRRKRMQGYEVLWLPGMDHAGIATQSVVEKQLAVDGKTKEDFGRELFIDKVWDWKHDSGGAIGGQMRRLGDGVDWSRDRFTMDDGLSRAVRTIFKRLYRRRVDLSAPSGWSTGRRCSRPRSPTSRSSTRTSKASWCPSATARCATTNPTSWSPPPGWRRCSATPRSPCTPTMSGTATWSVRPCRTRSSIASSIVVADDTSTPNSAPAQSKSHRRTIPTTSRSACDINCRCRRSWTPRA